MKLLFLAILSLFSNGAQAGEVWNYRLESQGVVKGGKLKLSELERSPEYRTWKFRYKLETSVGRKEGWIPYNLPEPCFDKNVLAALEIGQERNLGQFPHAWEAGRVLNYSLKRLAENQFLVANEEAKIVFFLAASGLWQRLESQFRLSSATLRLHGNLLEITEE
jgi:hypothetical protein